MKRARKHDEDNGFGAWGGYMEAKISKLEDQFLGVTTKQSNQLSNIFNGVSIFVNGYTNPSATELKTLMAEHGGIFHHYHRPGRTTYVIASNLPDVKVRSITSCKIISPEWVTDCIKANKLIDHTKYLLYTNQSKTQPKLAFASNVVLKTEEKSNAKSDIDLQISPDLFDSSGESFSEQIIKSNVAENEESLSNQLAPEVSEATLDQIFNDITSTNNKTDNETIALPESSSSSKKSTIKTAVDPGFLTEFYNNSRLHHIATLGAGFKQYITDLREKSDGIFPGIQILNMMPRTDFCRVISGTRIIMHIDMDCFFVSVGLRNRPHLRGLPVAVTHSKGGSKSHARPGTDIKQEIELYKQRNQLNSNDNDSSKEMCEVERRLCNLNELDSLSEIASCSYEARKAGVTNGMFMGAALKLCPNLKAIPYDFEGYKEVAYTLYDTIAKYTLNIEAVSCDEMFVDCTDLLKKTSVTVNEFAAHIRSEIKQKTSCPCSTGFGSNKLLARLATKKAKPDGQFHLEDHHVEEYIDDIPISDLPGVGRSTMSQLKTLGCHTCGDLKNITLLTLKKEFGNKTGESLYKNCRGIDDRALVYEQVRKSVSAEVNYGIRFKNMEEYETFLQKLAFEVHTRLKEVNRKGRCITLKLMIRSEEAPKETAKYMGHGFCDNMSKCQTLNFATDDVEVITRAVMNISKTIDIKPEDLRGIGIQISRLEKLTATHDVAKGSIVKLFKKVAENSKNNKLDDASNNASTSASENDTSSNNIPTSSKTVEKSKGSIKTFVKPLEELKESNDEIRNINFEVNASSSVSKEYKKLDDTVPAARISSPKKKDTSKKGKKLVKNKSNNTLEKFFGERKTYSKTLGPEDLRSLGIDPEVLSSLPEDLRNEVIRDCQIKAEKLNKPGPSKENTTTSRSIIEVDTEFLNAMPDDIRKEIEAEMMAEILSNNRNDTNLVMDQNVEIPQQPDKPKSSSVCGVEYSAIFGDIAQTRTLIRSWITKEMCPKFCDIEMLRKYLMEQVEDDIQNVYYIVKFLHRLISEQISDDGSNCHWHKAYSQILEGVQEAVLTFYGNKLFVENNFKCDYCFAI